MRCGRSVILTEKQAALGAHFFQVGDLRLPGYFTSTSAEYGAATQAVALMERSYLGLVEVTGVDHVDLLHRLTSNDLRALQPGQGQITVFPNETGRIVDRVFLLKFDDAFRLLTSMGKAGEVANWIEKFVFIEDVRVSNLADETGVLSLIGPRAEELLQAALDVAAGELALCAHRTIAWKGHGITVQRSAELQVPAYNLLGETAALALLWEHLLAVGASLGVAPAGQDAYDVLRTEAGWPLAASDFDDRINPHEAGMGAYVNLDKGCYIGQEVLARLDTYDKVQKHLMGVRFDGDTLPEARAAMFIDDAEAGFVTSAVASPTFGAIALGYVRTKFAEENVAVSVRSGGGSLSGRLTQLPFRR